MKTIRNSVFIGASLLGGCASVETRFDSLRVACVKDACYRERSALHAQRLWIALIALTKPTFRGVSWGGFLGVLFQILSIPLKKERQVRLIQKIKKINFFKPHF
ncbi:hypothetical protein HpHA5_06120 [Helicobacter pylori]